MSRVAEHRFSGLAIPVRFTGWWDPGDGDFRRDLPPASHPLGGRR